VLLKKEIAKTKTQKQEKTQPGPAHTLLKPSMLQLVKSLLHAPSIERRENFASYVCIFFVCFLRMIYKTREAHAKQFMQRW
jgi:hypothetical protein